MPRHNRHFVKLYPEKLEYKGNKAELTEYSVDEILLCSVENGSQLLFSVTLGRPLMRSVLTIYIPTLLLLIIRFSNQNTREEFKCLCSLFANVFADDFPDLVVQVNLTVLLVLASL